MGGRAAPPPPFFHWELASPLAHLWLSRDTGSCVPPPRPQEAPGPGAPSSCPPSLEAITAPVGQRGRGPLSPRLPCSRDAGPDRVAALLPPGAPQSLTFELVESWKALNEAFGFR